MKRLTWLALVVVGVVGCSDPATSRLERGSEAVIFDPSRDQVSLLVDSYAVEKDEGVDVGTRVYVLQEDPDPGLSELRKVKVRVLEGARDGLIGFVSRHSLRPR